MAITSNLLTGKTLALDSMIFIYHFDAVEPYFTHTQTIFTLAQNGEVNIITSIISVLESLSPTKYLNQPHTIKEIGLFFAEVEHLQILEINWAVALEAAKLRRENKSLRTPDSIQLATALTHHADVFVTNDDRLKNLSFPTLKILPVSQL